MEIKQRIEQDLKTALLAGDKVLATTLRGLKSSIQYAEVAKGNREIGLSDQEVVAVLAKEAKKRQESAELYRQGGNHERAELELAEKMAIEKYLPAQMSDEELDALVRMVISESSEMPAMGHVIAQVKAKSQGAVDGGRIAQAVKRQLEKS